MWFGSTKSKAALTEEAERVRRLLADAGIRAVVDGRRTRPGVRFGTADRCGAAVRIEVRTCWGHLLGGLVGNLCCCSTGTCCAHHLPCSSPPTPLPASTHPPTDWRPRRHLPHLHPGAPPRLRLN